MARTTLTFRLSGKEVLDELIRELSLHDDVVAHARHDELVIDVETSQSPSAVWEVRATVSVFDDAAVEIEHQP